MPLHSRRAAALLALAVVGSSLVLGGSPASAAGGDLNFSDTFEKASSPAWTFAAFGSGTGAGRTYLSDPGMARNGSGGATLIHTGAGFTTMYRTFSVPSLDYSCTGYVYAERFTYSNTTLKVNYEVIDTARWTYLALGSLNLPGPGANPYVKIGLPSFGMHPAPAGITVRVSVIGTPGQTDVVAVDDLSLKCTWIPEV